MLFKPRVAMAAQASETDVYILLEQAAALFKRRLFAQAESLFRQALTQEPASILALVGLADSLVGLRDHAQAEPYYLLALSLAPDVAQIYANYGVSLEQQGRPDEAVACYQQALERSPDEAPTWSNLGVALACMGRETQAETAFRKAIELDPQYDRARFNLSYLLLRQARFVEGWPCLECRENPFQANAFPPDKRLVTPLLTDQAVAIVQEGGFGDVLHFGRYLAVLKAAGARRVVLVCKTELVALMRGLNGCDEVQDLATCQFEHCQVDAWVPLLSMPGLFQTDLYNLPAHLPYIAVDPALRGMWAARLGPRQPGVLRVGVVWKGNPVFENDARRSIHNLNDLLPLVANPEFEIHSLQKGELDDTDREWMRGNRVLDHSSDLTDFAQTAAALSNMDVVVSVDSAVAHLAGATGRRCCLLLPAYKPDWRWLIDREDSPWYPGVMRLFRQQYVNDWSEPVSRVCEHLKGLWRAKQAVL